MTNFKENKPKEAKSVYKSYNFSFKDLKENKDLDDIYEPK